LTKKKSINYFIEIKKGNDGDEPKRIMVRSAKKLTHSAMMWR